MSAYSGTNPALNIPDDNNWTSERETATNEFEPSNKPVRKAGVTQFNLKSGVVVDGWLIYMRNENNIAAGTAITKDIYAKVVGDIIKSGPIAITTLANKTIDLGGVIKIPYYTAETNKVHYSGNSTRFASVPLNSEQYQEMYGDTEGSSDVTITEAAIYSFKKNVTDA